LRDVLACYRADLDGAQAGLADVPPYREYVAWLARQDQGAAETYWRRELAGFPAATPVGVEHAAASVPDATPGERVFSLDESTTDALKALGRRHGLTLSTIVQAAWAALLGRHAGEEDVLFGITVSGRPPEVRGVESMVGLFINTVPLR